MCARPPGWTFRLVSSRLRIDFGADLGGGEAGESECAGRAVAITRMPNSLVCRCGTGDVLEEAVLKSAGVPEADDHHLLSQIIDSPIREVDLEETVSVALALARASLSPS